VFSYRFSGEQSFAASWTGRLALPSKDYLSEEVYPN